MNDELELQLYKKYPKLFRQKDSPATETLMSWGICCGDGWFKLIDDACVGLQKLSEETGSIIEFAQIKEKYGSLRMYIDTQVSDPGVVTKAYNIVDIAERASEKTCDVCGEPGTITKNRGWLSTRCENHKIKETE
jgi:hypothetical protein